jgi:hypothetical protein
MCVPLLSVIRVHAIVYVRACEIFENNICTIFDLFFSVCDDLIKCAPSFCWFFCLCKYVVRVRLFRSLRMRCVCSLVQVAANAVCVFLTYLVGTCACLCLVCTASGCFMNVPC